METAPGRNSISARVGSAQPCPTELAIVGRVLQFGPATFLIEPLGQVGLRDRQLDQGGADRSDRLAPVDPILLQADHGPNRL
jgi:hypothetical protein